MLVGPFGLGALARRASLAALRHDHRTPHAIEPFAELGIVLLLFSIGLELSFRRLVGDAPPGVRHRRCRAARLGAVLIGGGLYLTGESRRARSALGLALALSSTAIVLPLVGTHSPVGRSALGMLLFEDLALVPIVFAARRDGAAAGERRRLAAGTIALGGVTAVAMLFARAARCSRRCSRRPRAPRAPSCSSRPACWS